MCLFGHMPIDTPVSRAPWQLQMGVAAGLAAQLTALTLYAPPTKFRNPGEPLMPHNGKLLVHAGAGQVMLVLWRWHQ